MSDDEVTAYICPPEICFREDEVEAVIIREDTAMQVYKSRPAMRLRHGQLGRGINDLLLQLGFDKSIIEICGDQANASFAS